MMLTLRVREEYDPELVEWLDSLPHGEKSIRVRDILKEHLRRQKEAKSNER